MIDSEMRRAIEAMSAHAERLVKRINEVNGDGYDDRGLVRVTCAPGGRLIDIELGSETRRMQTYELRDAILLAAERATLAADDAMREAVSGFGELSNDLSGHSLVRQAQQQVAQYQALVDEQIDKIQKLRSGLR